MITFYLCLLSTITYLTYASFDDYNFNFDDESDIDEEGPYDSLFSQWLDLLSNKSTLQPTSHVTNKHRYIQPTNYPTEHPTNLVTIPPSLKPTKQPQTISHHKRISEPSSNKSARIELLTLSTSSTLSPTTKITQQNNTFNNKSKQIITFLYYNSDHDKLLQLKNHLVMAQKETLFIFPDSLIQRPLSNQLLKIKTAKGNHDRIRNTNHILIKTFVGLGTLLYDIFGAQKLLYYQDWEYYFQSIMDNLHNLNDQVVSKRILSALKGKYQGSKHELQKLMPFFNQFRELYIYKKRYGSIKMQTIIVSMSERIKFLINLIVVTMKVLYETIQEKIITMLHKDAFFKSINYSIFYQKQIKTESVEFNQYLNRTLNLAKMIYVENKNNGANLKGLQVSSYLALNIGAKIMMKMRELLVCDIILHWRSIQELRGRDMIILLHDVDHVPFIECFMKTLQFDSNLSINVSVFQVIRSNKHQKYLVKPAGFDGIKRNEGVTPTANVLHAVCNGMAMVRDLMCIAASIALLLRFVSNIGLL